MGIVDNAEQQLPTLLSDTTRDTPEILPSFQLQGHLRGTSAECQDCLPKVMGFGNPAVLQTLKIVICLTHRLKETFEDFLGDRQDDASIVNLTGCLSPDLLLKNVISIWKTALRTSKLFSSTIQKGPT